jgi:hypothetical protein
MMTERETARRFPLSFISELDIRALPRRSTEMAGEERTAKSSSASSSSS